MVSEAKEKEEVVKLNVITDLIVTIDSFGTAKIKDTKTIMNNTKSTVYMDNPFVQSVHPDAKMDNMHFEDMHGRRAKIEFVRPTKGSRSIQVKFETPGTHFEIPNGETKFYMAYDVPGYATKFDKDRMFIANRLGNLLYDSKGFFNNIQFNLHYIFEKPKDRPFFYNWIYEYQIQISGLKNYTINRTRKTIEISSGFSIGDKEFVPVAILYFRKKRGYINFLLGVLASLVAGLLLIMMG